MSIKEAIAEIVVAANKNKDANASAILEFQRLGQLVIDNAEGIPKLQELGREITAQAEALAAAIPANTPDA